MMQTCFASCRPVWNQTENIYTVIYIYVPTESYTPKKEG